MKRTMLMVAALAAVSILAFPATSQKGGGGSLGAGDGVCDGSGAGSGSGVCDGTGAGGGNGAGAGSGVCDGTGQGSKGTGTGVCDGSGQAVTGSGNGLCDGTGQARKSSCDGTGQGNKGGSGGTYSGTSKAGGPGSGGGGGGGGGNSLQDYIASLPIQTLDAVELAELRQMRQEEKLARDVYLTLHYFWKLNVFENIAASEQSHMDLVLTIFDRYGVADPLISDKIGVYPDPVFGNLYGLLINVGQASLVNAVAVGAIIEDLDIYDLNEALAHTDNLDMATVWQNLNQGSRNHMRAFYDLLLQQNLVYPGLFLTEAEILDIVNSPKETGPVDENGVPLS